MNKNPSFAFRSSKCHSWGLLAGWLLLGTPIAAAQTLKIGVVGDMRAPSQAKSISTAVSLAIEDAKKSRSLTQDVEVLTNDDECKPDRAKTIAQKLAQDKRINLAVGHSCAAASLAASDAYREARILQIDPVTTHPSLTERTREKPAPLFRVAERQDRAAAIAVLVLRKQIAGKNVCLVGDASRKTWLDRFQTLAAGAPKKVTISDSIPDQTSSDDLCVVYDPYNHSGLNKLGERDNLYAVLGPDDQFLSPSANADAIKDFAKRMKTAGHSGALGPAINAYASIQIWIKAMNEARSTDTDKVAEQMRKLKFETIRGLVTFDEIGDVKQPLITIVQYADPRIQVPNECNEDKCKNCACSGCCPTP